MEIFREVGQNFGYTTSNSSLVLLETLDSQPQNDPASDETDIGEQEDGYNNTADDSTLDNFDSSEASGSGTPTVIRSRTPSQNSSRSGSQLKMMQMLQQGMGGINNFYSPYGSVLPPPSPGLYYSPSGHTSNDS